MANVCNVRKDLIRCSKIYNKHPEKWGIDKELGCKECQFRWTGGCQECLMTSAVVVIDDLRRQIDTMKNPREKDKGTWITKKNALGKMFTMCSKCQTVICTYNDNGGTDPLDLTGAKYCPECGSPMKTERK